MGCKWGKIIAVLCVVIISWCLGIGCGSSGTESPSPTEATSEPLAVQDLTPGPITVISSNTEVDFPKSLTFDLVAESASDIVGVELRYRIIKVTSVSVITTIKPDFIPSTRVEASWDWDTRKNSLPPGSEIEYQWVIKNTSGEQLKTESVKITFEDLRYDWQELLEGDVRLFWYEGGESFARELMDAAQAGLDKLAMDTGARLDKQVKIYVYEDSQDLREALVYSQEWTGGVAFTEYGIVAIGISPGNLDWGKRIIAHELAHLVIHQVTFSPYSDLPTWLNEGLAMYAEGDLRGDLAGGLSEAISSNMLFSVRSLGSSFPADAEEAGLAYAQSYSLVKFLIDNYGSDKMLKLLQVFKEGSTTDDALLEVYEFDGDRLDTLWRVSVGVEESIESGFQVIVERPGGHSLAELSYAS